MGFFFEVIQYLQASCYLTWYYLSKLPCGTDPCQPLCSSTRTHSSDLSLLIVTTPGFQGRTSSLTATTISIALNSHRQRVAAFSHIRCFLLPSSCCDSSAKSISRGDLKQERSYFLVCCPSRSIHLKLQGHLQHFVTSGILKHKEKGNVLWQ